MHINIAILLDNMYNEAFDLAQNLANQEGLKNNPLIGDTFKQVFGSEIGLNCTLFVIFVNHELNTYRQAGLKILGQTAKFLSFLKKETKQGKVISMFDFKKFCYDGLTEKNETKELLAFFEKFVKFSEL